MEEIRKLGEIEYAEGVWTLLTESKFELSLEVLKHKLEDVKRQLHLGIMVFTPPSPESDQMLRGQLPEKIFDFVVELRKLLGIDAVQAYDILCDYLVHAFQGTEVGLKACLVGDNRLRMLMTDIWEFYRSERLYLLKCVHVLLMSAGSRITPRECSLAHIIDSSEEAFLDRLISQFEAIQKEEYPTKIANGEIVSKRLQMKWLVFNLREQMEVLQNMIFFADMKTVPSSQFRRIVHLCIENNFGQKYLAYISDDDLIKDYSRQIGYLENVLLLRCLNLSFPDIALDWTLSMDFTHLDETFDSLNDSEMSGPIILTWTLLKVLTVPGSYIPFIHEKLGFQALHLGAFEYLRKLLESNIFQNYSTMLSTIAFRTVLHLFSLFTNNFDPSDLKEVDGLFLLLGPLLRHPTVADEVWKIPQGNGIRSLIPLIVVRFPLQFTAFLEVAEALASARPAYVPELYVLVKQLDQYQEAQGGSNESSSSSDENDIYEDFTNDEPVAHNDVREYPPLFAWHCHFNVFETIIDRMRFLMFQISNGYMEEEVVQIVCKSLKFLKAWFKLERDIEKEEMAVINHIFFLLEKLKMHEDVSSQVFAYCVDIALVLYERFPAEVTHLKFLNIFPTLRSVPANLTLVFSSDYFSSNTVGAIVSNQEQLVGKYWLLKSYLSYVEYLIKCESSVEDAAITHLDVILPGVIYILVEVLPCYNRWRFTQEGHYEDVIANCLDILHELLTMQYVNNPNPEVTTSLLVIQKVALHNLLNFSAGKELLKLAASGMTVIQDKMQRQLNLFSGIGTDMVYMVRLALSLVNRVLQLRAIAEDEGVISPLIRDIFSSPERIDSLRFIPTVTSYINNIYCRNLPVMAVSLLARCAMCLPRTMFPCLGMDADVFRDLVFKKLNSKLETSLLKESLIHLMTACIENQPGMCDALFNMISNERKEEKKSVRNDVAGGCLVYICSVLEKVAQEEIAVTSILYGAVVDFLFTLWLGNCDVIVNFFKQKDGFWKSFCAPLLRKPGMHSYAFTQTFTVMTLELFQYRSNISPSLLIEFKKFFNESGAAEFWTEFLSVYSNGTTQATPVDLEQDTLKMTLEKLPPNLQLLISMKWFLGLSLRFLPFKIDEAQIIHLAKFVMEAIQNELKMPDLKRLLLLTELYLLLITKVEGKFFQDAELLKDQISHMLTKISVIYPDASIRLRESALAVILKVVNFISKEFQEGERTKEFMILSACDIACIELSDLGDHHISLLKRYQTDQSGEDKESLTKHHTTSCKLSLHLLQSLLKIADEHMCYSKDDMFPKLIHLVLEVYGSTLRLSHDRQMVVYHIDIAEQLMVTLLLLIRGKALDVSLETELARNVWNQLLPPKYLDAETWIDTEWVRVYKPALDIISKLLSHQGFQFVEIAITFAGVHCEYLSASIVSLRHSLDPVSLDLSIAALNFVRVLSSYQEIWKFSHNFSMKHILQGVMSCLHAIVALMIHPTMLKRLMERTSWSMKKKPHTQPSEADITSHATHVQNQVLKMAYLCFTILQAFTPRLTDMFRAGGATATCEPMLQLDFSVPVLDTVVPMPPLTFGTLITLANLCTQILGKGMRASGASGTSAKSNRQGSKLGSSLVMSMDKHYTTVIFEMALEMVTSQGILCLNCNALSRTEREIFKRSLNNEMTFLWMHLTRIYRQKAASGHGSEKDSTPKLHSSKKRFQKPTLSARLKYGEHDQLRSNISKTSSEKHDEKTEPSNEQASVSMNVGSSDSEDLQEWHENTTEDFIHFILKVFNKFIAIPFYHGM